MKRTTVVNIKDSDYDVYIGGSNTHYGLEASKFANPFSITKHRTREQSIASYRRWFYSWLENVEGVKEKVEELRGKRLGCWCHPKPCHGDIIVEYLGDNWF